MISTEGLRPIVENLDREMARLLRPGVDGADTAALRASWAALVDYLALGPAPDLQACPHCGRLGMRAATRCGACWRKLVPPPPASA